MNKIFVYQVGNNKKVALRNVVILQTGSWNFDA